MVHASIARKAGVGALIAVLLLAGVLVTAAFGEQAGGPTEPQVIELVTRGCGTDDDDPATFCKVFEPKDTDGDRSGQIVRFRVPLSDVDANPVGQLFLQCDGAKTTGETCSTVLSLKPGPHTEQGTIVSMGNKLPAAAILGGSGAYLNAGGEITGEEQPDGFHMFVNLVP